MKLVYIAGPYGDKGGYLAIDRNIAVVREVAARLGDNLIGFMAPHLNSAHFEAILPHVPVEFWYQMDLRLMAPCDAVVVIGDPSMSTGVTRELEEWAQTGKPVFYLAEHDAWDRLIDWAHEIAEPVEASR